MVYPLISNFELQNNNIESLYLDAELSIYKAQIIWQPECTIVHEDCKIVQQRSEWVALHSNIIG